MAYPLFNHDVLNVENSILINPDKINEIADAINKLYSDHVLREMKAQKSLEMGGKLAIERRAYDIITFMHEKIQQRKKKWRSIIMHIQTKVILVIY